MDKGPADDPALRRRTGFYVVKDTAEAEPSSEKRRAKRQRVLKMGQLILGYQGSTIDCLITDETRFGAVVEVPVGMEIPADLKIRFVGGVTVDALRRWAAGNKVGFEYAAATADDAATERQRLAVGVVLRDVGVMAAVKMLREAGFYGNDKLRAVAETLELGYAQLESMLR